MPHRNLSSTNLKNFSKKFNKTRANKVFKNINTKGDFENLIIKADYLQNKKHTYKNYIESNTKITNQHNSGRCWLFAFLNVMRIPMSKKYRFSLPRKPLPCNSALCLSVILVEK